MLLTIKVGQMELTLDLGDAKTQVAVPETKALGEPRKKKAASRPRKKKAASRPRKKKAASRVDFQSQVSACHGDRLVQRKSGEWECMKCGDIAEAVASDGWRPKPKRKMKRGEPKPCCGSLGTKHKKGCDGTDSGTIDDSLDETL